MKSKFSELILIAAVVGSVYTDACVYSPWKRGDCNCRSKSIPITRRFLWGDTLTNGDDCNAKTELTEPCDCSKYIYVENIYENVFTRYKYFLQ